MKTIGFLNLIFILSLAACHSSQATDQAQDAIAIADQPVVRNTTNTYSWLHAYDIRNAIVNRIPVPEGFKRVEAKEGSFAGWLRHLPLKPGTPEVHLYNGALKRNQKVHAAVLDIDVGTTDIQQCADAVMRLRGEYLYAQKNYSDLHFNFTSGDLVSFSKWSQGYRTQIKGNKVSWVKSAAPDTGYKTFKSYMNTIFNYAGTSSLSKELKKVEKVTEIQAGDVFILGGFPGHAVLVTDVCQNEKGEKLFLLVQSYMPAQEIHILKNYTDATISPWYRAAFSGDLETPEWTFTKDQLRRW